MIKVAIISPYRFQNYVNSALAGHDFGCAFKTYTYDQVTDIDRISVECRKDCDVILFTGELGYHYMRAAYPDFPVPCEFTVYGTADVMSILLSFHLRHPDIALSRVYLDFLTPMNNYMNIQDYLSPEQLPCFFEGGSYDYTNITGQALRLWESGRIDFVISRSINNLQAWQRLGIPFEAVYPTEPMIRKSVEEAVNRERLKSIDDTSFVTFIVHLPAGEDSDRMEEEYRLATMFKLLVDNRREQKFNYSIQQGFDRFVCSLEVSSEEVKKIDYRGFVRRLQKSLDFDFSVGFGIHMNEQTSRYHAERALLESSRYGRNEGFLVSGDPAVITGPLSRSVTVHYSYQDVGVTKLSKKLGVNNGNIMRLISLYRRDPNIVLTAAELEPLLGVTLRSTRRILQKLYDMGIITPAENIPDGGRGRPHHRYVFVPEALECALAGEE